MLSDELPVAPAFDTVDSGLVDVPLGQQKVVLRRVGEATSWDVWVDTPGDWEDNVQFAIYACLGGQRVQVTGSEFGEMEGAAPYRKILCSVRGWPCAAIEVVITNNVGINLIGGRFQLTAWVGTEQRSISVGSRTDLGIVRVNQGSPEVLTRVHAHPARDVDLLLPHRTAELVRSAR